MNKLLYTLIPAPLKLRMLSAFCCLMLAQSLAYSAALLFYGDEQGGIHPVLRADVSDAVSALQTLTAVPSSQEAGGPVVSGLLPGTKVLGLQTEGDTTTVEFSPDILGSNAAGTGLDEARLTMILEQVRATLRQFGVEGSIRLQTEGKLLCEYLPPVTPVAPGPAVKETTPEVKGSSALGGRNITIGPSHGRFWNGSGWYWQRGDPCGYGEAVLEDCNSIRLMQFLYQYLTQDGATVHVPRELNESNCCNGYEGLYWWKMAAYSWLRANSLPCSVWASSSGNCGEETATGRNSDDIRARPLFADYRNSEIYIAHHTNAGGGGTANGTETYRDTEMEHPAHEANSLTLATAVNNNVVSAIRSTYPGESAWSNRGVKDAAGGFGEIRIPNRPAILIELAFHDNCSRDAAYLTDNFFRSVAEWGLYKGVCEYFGTTPTWDKYSDEYVSDTIPSTMNPGQSYSVSVTFRNRGVVWSEARSFRLGSVGDSDPFTATTRHTISGEVKPGSTYTFNFTMTAPTAAGTYTTDWRMVRDGYAWFGATHSEQVTVSSPGTPVITTQPVSQTVMVSDAASFSVAATGDAPLTYQWRRNGSNLSDGGSVWGVTATTLTITNAQAANAGTYTVLVSNPNGSTLSAGAVLTVQLGNPASWGPFNASVERDIRGGTGVDTGYSSVLRLAQYTTTPTDDKSRCLWDFDTTTAPDSSLAASGDNCTFTFYHTPTATYSCGTTMTKYQTYARLYALAQDWTSAAIWTKRDGVNNWTTAGGTLGNQLGAEQLLYGNCDTTFTLAFAQSLFPGGNPSYGVILTSPQEGDTANPATHRKGISSKNEQAGNPEQWATFKINYLAPAGTANGVIRNWAYLGWFDQGATADRQLRIDTDQVAGTYGGVPVTEANVAPKVGATSYGNSYGLRQWAEATYTNDLVNLNSSHFYNAVHENAVTYCFVYVRNSKGSDITGAYLGIGSDDGCKVWWNGADVGSDVVSRGVSADADFWGPLTISNGWNRLLVKVENGGTGHGVYARFANANRTALTDRAHLSFYTTDSTAPGTPTDLTVAGVTGGIWQNAVAAPAFTWTSGADSQGAGEGVSGVRGQKFYFGTDVNGSPNAFQTGSSYAPGTQADGKYYFKVGTVDYALNDSGTAAFTFMYDGSAPAGVSLGFGTITTDTIEVTGAGTDAHSGINASTGYNYSRTGASESGPKGTTHLWTGLVPNTEYTGLAVTVSDQAVPTPNAAASLPQSQWTLSVAPSSGSVTADEPAPVYGGTNIWTAVGGFGAGAVQSYRYAFDQSPTHTWTENEAQWSNGTLATVPTAVGTWYLHVKGYNGAGVGNGTYDYPLTVAQKALTVAGIEAQNKAYDGTTSATLILDSAVLAGVVSGDEVSLDTTSATGAFEDANVGTGKTVTISGLELAGANAGNYALTAPTATADITGAATTTTLVSSENPSEPGSNVTFTATVASDVGTPEGDVVFLASDVPFSTNALAGGVAAASTTALPLGTNIVAVQYAAQGNYLGSSDSLEQAIQNLAPCSQTNVVVSITDNPDGTFTINFQGTPLAQYYVVAGSDLTQAAGWAPLSGSTNTVADTNGLWSVTVSNTEPQRFYRSAAVSPCP
ncbi:MAG TPA: YDG domain-containing protein [Candidatus Paceibacterota bacterium]|nr:YDG domain-containing protein [Verrucomicrobiota bacterium]HSA10449.1 YDG domain-containing protein [Candidatus Paceibacterota bacterium]